MIERIAKKLLLQKIAFNIVEAELTEQQKKQVDWYTRWRSKSLSFGEMFNSERTYFSIGASTLSTIQIPQQIQKIIDKEGYYCPDYRKGYVYKKDDKLKNKPVKLIKILNKGEKDKDKFVQLKKQFDERLFTSRKQNIKCEICITHNPYDVAGMSTDRNWTSCMNLDGGAYSQTPLKQVQYGGMCAYLIEKQDRNIEKPIARIAIKRLISDNNSFMFAAEDVIYGDVGFANELNFMQKVVDILNKSNQKTMNDSKVFHRDDEDSYSDSDIYWIINIDNDKEFLDFIEQDPYIINEDGFLNSISQYRKYLLFDYLIEFGKSSELLELFYDNYLNNDEINQMVDCLINDHAVFRMKLFLRGKKDYVEARKKVIDKLVETRHSQCLFELIREENLTSEQKKFTIDKIIDQGYAIILRNVLIDINKYVDLEQKNKIIKKLIELEEYQKLISLISQDYIDKNNINILAESIINLPENERDVYILSEVLIKGNNSLTEENKQKIKKLIFSEGTAYQYYDLIYENKLNLQEQVIAAKNILDKAYYSQAYEYLFNLIRENKFDSRIKDDVLDIIIQDVTQRYDNAQITQFYLNEIKRTVDSLR